MDCVREVELGATTRRGSIWRRAVLGRLAAMTSGELEIEDAVGFARVGQPAADGLSSRIVVHRNRFWRRVALGGSLAASESFIDGDWDADDLTRAVRLFARNLDQLDRVDSGLGRVLSVGARVRHALARNTRAGSRRNVAAHYDLGNEFFEAMLDPTLTYSCGIFERAESSLEDASLAKIDRLCAKLDLGPHDHLLEIGSGWGAFAIRAASRHGCRVTTTTLSARQHEVAARRVAEAGLSDRVEVLRTDYRDLRGVYTKLVSVEMIEAVGAEFYRDFFRACSARLTPHGLMAMQAITISDRRFERARREVDFIKRFVFPGSCIPSVTALLDAATDASDLSIIDLEDITPHYPRTLAAWRANLARHAERVAAMTTDSFRRLWQFYLAYCEGGFLERRIGVAQIVLARSGFRR